MAPADQSRFFGKQNMRGILITTALIVSFFVPTPYYLYQPGDAEELAPMISVEKGTKDEKGTLMLTTVLSIRATNIYYLGYGLVAPHTDLRKEEDVKGDLTDREYERSLKHMMDSSQQNAIISGLQAAGEKVDVKYHGVFVKSFRPNTKAKGILEVGDVITAVDGRPVLQAKDMTDYINQTKKPGETATLTFKRDDKEQTAKIELVTLERRPDAAPDEKPLVGFGMTPEDERTLELPRKVEIHAEDIGGPSAGLMFSLEIFSQLTPGDLTKGYRIAGTGTIDQDGNVGQIGGIRHKIVAADKEEADIFFAPADLDEGYTNAAEATDEAKAIGTKMKVVPVATLQEALDYLQKLPTKGKS